MKEQGGFLLLHIQLAGGAVVGGRDQTLRAVHVPGEAVHWPEQILEVEIVCILNFIEGTMQTIFGSLNCSPGMVVQQVNAVGFALSVKTVPQSHLIVSWF